MPTATCSRSSRTRSSTAWLEGRPASLLGTRWQKPPTEGTRCGTPTRSYLQRACPNTAGDMRVGVCPSSRARGSATYISTVYATARSCGGTGCFSTEVHLVVLCTHHFLSTLGVRSRAIRSRRVGLLSLRLPASAASESSFGSRRWRPFSLDPSVAVSTPVCGGDNAA